MHERCGIVRPIRHGPAERHRRPEIDLAKGACICAVVLIHSRPLVGTLFHQVFINRAVPVFVVLFGLTSELWWWSRAGGPAPILEWYRARYRRLLVPLWGAVTLWWIGVAVTGAEPVTAWRVAQTFAGYLASLRTGWFVTLVVQLVLLFPILRVAVERLGVVAMFVASTLIALVANIHMWDVIRIMRWLLLDTSPHPHAVDLFYYSWIFAPASFVLVVAGMAIARYPVLSSRRAAVVAAVAFAAGTAIVRTRVTDDAVAATLLSPLDAALTVALLGLLASVDARTPVARALAWCGRASWGLYLGQMLIHDWLHVFDIRPEEGPIAVRWAYACALLLGAAGAVVVGERVRTVAAHLLTVRR